MNLYFIPKQMRNCARNYHNTRNTLANDISSLSRAGALIFLYASQGRIYIVGALGPLNVGAHELENCTNQMPDYQEPKRTKRKKGISKFDHKPDCLDPDRATFSQSVFNLKCRPSDNSLSHGKHKQILPAQQFTNK